MIELLLGSVLGVSMCQEPVRLEVGVARSVASEQWVVSDVEHCDVSSLKVFRSSKEPRAAKDGNPTGSSVDPEKGCAARTLQRSEVLYFASGSSDVADTEALKLIALTHETPKRVTIVGYTDAHGSWEFNRQLATARSQAVWDLWKRIGGPLPTNGVRLRGLPLCCYLDQHELSRNRRVTITIEREGARC